MIFLIKRLLLSRWWCGGCYAVEVKWPVYTFVEDTERVVAGFKAEMDRLLKRMDR